MSGSVAAGIAKRIVPLFDRVLVQVIVIDKSSVDRVHMCCSVEEVLLVKKLSIKETPGGIAPV
jgi:hypothetical protein